MTEERGLVARPNGGAVSLSGFGPAVRLIAGLEAFTPSMLGLRPDELRIIHKVDNDQIDKGWRPGMFRLNKEVFPSLRVVFLKAAPFRLYRSGQGDDTKITCISRDGWEPAEMVAQPRARHCFRRLGDNRVTVCPEAMFDRRPDGSVGAPVCKEGVAFIGIRPDAGDRPFWFPTSGAAAMAATACVHALQQAAPEGLCQFSVELTTEHKKNRGVEWYQPVFTIDHELIPFERYRAYVQALAGVYYTPPLSPTAMVQEDPVDVPEAAASGQTIEVVSSDDAGLPF